MSKQRTVELETNMIGDKKIEQQENTAPISLSTKLERRRRIEEINDEKRLREELSAF